MFLLAFAGTAQAQDATKLARDAFFVVEATPFDTTAVRKAAADLERALLAQKRYDEAIEEYTRAIAISPYPMAEEQLKKAKLLKTRPG